MTPAYLTVAEACEYARRHPTTLWRALESGQLHGSQRKARGKWAIRPECLDAWLAGQPCDHDQKRKTA
jgi:hypothetical protein